MTVADVNRLIEINTHRFGTGGVFEASEVTAEDLAIDPDMGGVFVFHIEDDPAELFRAAANLADLGVDTVPICFESTGVPALRVLGVRGQ